MSRRIDAGLDRGVAFTFSFDGQSVDAFPGETVAAALLAADVRRFRASARRELPRGLYCGMGVCWECLVVIDGKPSNRACMTEARPGMRVETQRGVGGTGRP
jgi:predicted molibdopterin-dependent oxidoreductase YjgC